MGYKSIATDEKRDIASREKSFHIATPLALLFRPLLEVLGPVVSRPLLTETCQTAARWDRSAPWPEPHQHAVNTQLTHS